jgi:hypothetical protein
MASPTVSARIGDTGPVVKIQLADTGVLADLEDPEQDVAIGKVFSFDGVIDSIGAVSSAVTEALRKAQPEEAEVEFGIDVAVEAGQLTSLLVKGSGTATLSVRLLWKKNGAADEALNDERSGPAGAPSEGDGPDRHR